METEALKGDILDDSRTLCERNHGSFRHHCPHYLFLRGEFIGGGRRSIKLRFNVGCVCLRRFTQAMSGDNLLPFAFPNGSRKKVTAAFDSSVLAAGDFRSASWLSNCLARCFPNDRYPLRVAHTLADMTCGWVLAIACSYEGVSILKRNYRAMGRLLRNVVWGEKFLRQRSRAMKHLPSLYGGLQH